MAFELTCPVHFERHCVNFGLVTFNDQGAKAGVYADWFTPRSVNTFEAFVYSLSRETQLEAFTHRIAVLPTMDATAEADALMGQTARSVRILHACGMQFVGKRQSLGQAP